MNIYIRRILTFGLNHPQSRLSNNQHKSIWKGTVYKKAAKQYMQN